MLVERQEVGHVRFEITLHFSIKKQGCPDSNEKCLGVRLALPFWQSLSGYAQYRPRNVLVLYGPALFGNIQPC